MDNQDIIDYGQDFGDKIPKELKIRLDMIIQTVPKFWESRRNGYDHFTNHGPSHSERVHRQKLAQLAQELPPNQRLKPDEVFVISAAAWLYEIGIQCPTLKPILDFECQPDEQLTPLQLQEIRAKKHLLTEQMIYDSVNPAYRGPTLELGLTRPVDDYIQAIAEVCKGCSGDSIEDIPEILPVNGMEVRARLLTALLRLADQLYIDPARVDLDLLIFRSKLTDSQFARWWAYHYTQTMQVGAGQIRFYYFMPESQQEYLDFIRGVIEPGFDYDKNDVMRYLWDRHQLRLRPSQTPFVRIDRQFGTQRLMSHDTVMYLRREISPILTPDSIKEEPPTDRALLVLDFENFVIQLGQMGYFLSPETMSQAVIDLLKAANDQIIGTVHPVTVGHWDRPDLKDAAQMLQENIFELITVRENETVPEVIRRHINARLKDPVPPRQITLAAPQRNLAAYVRDLIDAGETVFTWISNLPEASIFKALMEKRKDLASLLGLKDGHELSYEQLEAGQTACILALYKQIRRAVDGISYSQVRHLLERLETVDRHLDFWGIWLFHQNILLPVGQLDYVRLNLENELVAQIAEMLNAVILAFNKTPQENQGTPQEALLREIVTDNNMQDERTLLRFMEILKEEGLLTRLMASPMTGGQIMWQLNKNAEEVVEANIDTHMAPFILALDHFMARDGHRSVHEHKITKLASNLIPEHNAKVLYSIAQDNNWVLREDTRQRFRSSNDIIWGVSPNEKVIEVAQILRNQDILLNCLYRHNIEGITFNVLRQRVMGIKSFTLDNRGLDTWIHYLEKQDVIIVDKFTNGVGSEQIRVNIDDRLVQQLFGRMHVHNLVTTFRIQKASSRDTSKPYKIMLEKVAQFVTKRNTQRASWAMNYAQSIRVLRVEGDNVFLNYHSLVKELDNREQKVCQALLDLVNRSGSGWIPKGVIFREMEKDLDFGYSRGEHEYWLNTAIHRRKLLIERPDDRTSVRVKC